MSQVSFTVSAVAGGGSKTQNQTSFPNLAVLMRVRVTPQQSGGTFKIQLFRKDGFAAADINFDSGTVSGTYETPHEDDDGTTAQHAQPALGVCLYEDEDASNELHVKIVNDDASARDFDVVVEYLAMVGAMTSGSVLFAGANGDIKQDNSNLYWDDSNNRLSVGAGTSPARRLTVLEGNVQIISHFKNTNATRALVTFSDNVTANDGKCGIGAIGDNLLLYSTGDRIIIGPSGRIAVGSTSLPSGGGTPVMVMAQAGSNPTGLPSNTAGWFVKDVTGTAEFFVIDEAGTATQISPHDPETGEYWLNSENIYTGVRKIYRLERMIRAVEALTGESFIEEMELPERQSWGDHQEFLRLQREEEIARWDSLTEEQRETPRPEPYAKKPKPRR